MNDATWYVVRNTRGVTGFVGPGSKPVPLTDEEMAYLGINKETVTIDVEVGDMIQVTSGAWEGTVGNIKAINTNKQTVTIDVEIFGRATSVEIAFVDIKKL
jgi:transcriptional antiterminator NusG